MTVLIKGEVYSVNIPCANPFARMGNWIVGLTPWVRWSEEIWSQLLAAWCEKLSNLEIQEWDVENSDGTSYYRVRHADGVWSCPCYGFQYRGSCRHVDQCEEIL